jgi:Xaa-Pro aminopeptidase
MSYDRRLAAARAAMGEAGVGAMVVSGIVNVRYLTGFTGSNGLVVIGPEAATLLTDFRYQTASDPLRAWIDVELAERDVIRTAADRLGDLAAGAGNIGFEPALLTVERHAILAEAVTRLTPVPGLIEKLRAVKDEEELDAIRASARLIEPVYAAIAEGGLIGRTEQDVAWRVRELFHAGGADDIAFDTIVASHERGAQPHAKPAAVPIGADTLVTIDLGCVLAGYNSDCTRTFATGTPAPELARAYEVCLRAQLAAMDAVRPGIPASVVDLAARSLIEDAGYGKRFGHPTGHGLGLDVHEAPRVGATTAATLEPGMVVTVEPGIYLPGVGGVRIEDLVIVTATGGERLTMYPKDLVTVG